MTDDALDAPPRRRGRPPLRQGPATRQVPEADTAPSWWLGKDRAAFSAERKKQEPRMAGSKTAKVMGYQEAWKTKGQMP